MKNRPVNLARLKDESRRITVYWEELDKFLVHFEDIDGMEESLIEFNFESLLKTYQILGVFIQESCMNSQELRMKLANKSQSKIEISKK